MAYRVGLPGWKWAARLGFETLVRVRITWDPDAEVFVALSDDLDELAVEAKSLDELRQDIGEIIPDLLADRLKVPPQSPSALRSRTRLVTDVTSPCFA